MEFKKILIVGIVAVLALLGLRSCNGNVMPTGADKAATDISKAATNVKAEVKEAVAKHADDAAKHAAPAVSTKKVVHKKRIVRKPAPVKAVAPVEMPKAPAKASSYPGSGHHKSHRNSFIDAGK